MTVSTEVTRVQYDCDDDQTVFPFEFGIFAETNLLVILTNTTTGVETTLVLTTHYTVSKAGNTWNDGGNITTIATYAAGYTITVMLALPYAQTADYREGDSFPAETTETRLDYVTRLVKQIVEILSRVPMLKKSTAYLNMILPDPIAARFLRWKDDLTGLENVNASDLGDATLVFSDDGTLGGAPKVLSFTDSEGNTCHVKGYPTKT